MKTFEEIMRKRQELLDECVKQDAVSLSGIYSLVYVVGHNDAPSGKQPSTVSEILWTADVAFHFRPSVSKIFGYREHRELYKKCYKFVHDLCKLAHGRISWEDMDW